MVSLFTDEHAIKQSKFLNELVALKREEFEKKMYRGFYGTSEECRKRTEEVEAKVQRYIDKLETAFPDVPISRVPFY
ncbi:hypothetical protein [Lysinibacillus fusiformis]|uniref:hypothetical protein n=1 Tax=Lysinibacillus fusiformis TaxID=28031 RepID=UPI00187E4967|nr:hypothetical protein [Lysinibacillus fusiformis]MBD8523896.1 hypothetical protein [Lysinibacillus fusiformis]